jgi:predicted transposase YdaD
MGRYDITLKYFAAKYPQAYIRLALGAVLPQAQEVEVSAFRLLDKKLPEVELEVDFLAEVTHAGETFVLHPDFQTRYDSEMRERMLDYRVRVRRAYGKPVLSVVIWLTAEGYPGAGHNRLEEVICGQRQLVFEFAEVRLWELEPADYLKAGETALLPLVPLMGVQPSAETLTQAVAAVAAMPDAVERADLYTGLWVLGGLRYSRELLRSLIRREAMKESPTYLEILEEGALEGALRRSRDAIVDVLSARFGDVPSEIASALAEIDDSETLRRLLRLAACCESIADFRAQMTRGLN